jgi:membrane-associated phospholipid phosphatase
MIKYYAIPKVWFSVLLYFAIIELVIIFTKPSLFFDWNFILTRVIFVFAFTFSVIIKRKISKNFFQLLQNILVFALMTFLYKETAMLNTLIFPKIDEFLSNLDQNIFKFQPSIEFSKHFNSLFFSELFYFGYFCYYLLPLVVLGILYKFLPQKIEEFGFILITSFLLYYFIFIIIPAEGPQFYFTFPDNYIEAQGIFGNAIKLIQKNGEAPTAAFPSSHVGISWIVIFWLYQNFRKSVKYFLPFVILLMFSTVYIKAHYFVDVVAGFISAPIVFFLTFKFYKFLNHKLDVRFD